MRKAGKRNTAKEEEVMTVTPPFPLYDRDLDRVVLC